MRAQWRRERHQGDGRGRERRPRTCLFLLILFLRALRSFGPASQAGGRGPPAGPGVRLCSMPHIRPYASMPHTSPTPRPTCDLCLFRAPRAATRHTRAQPRDHSHAARNYTPLAPARAAAVTRAPPAAEPDRGLAPPPPRPPAARAAGAAFRSTGRQDSALVVSGVVLLKVEREARDGRVGGDRGGVLGGPDRRLGLRLGRLERELGTCAGGKRARHWGHRQGTRGAVAVCGGAVGAHLTHRRWRPAARRAASGTRRSSPSARCGATRMRARRAPPLDHRLPPTRFAG